MMSVFPRAVRDVQHSTLADVAEIPRVFAKRAEQGFHIAEIHNVTTTLDRFAKLCTAGKVLLIALIAGMDQQVSNCCEVGCEDDSIAGEDDVSGSAFHLPIGTNRAMLNRLNTQSVPFFFSYK